MPSGLPLLEIPFTVEKNYEKWFKKCIFFHCAKLFPFRDKKELKMNVLNVYFPYFPIHKSRTINFETPYARSRITRF